MADIEYKYMGNHAQEISGVMREPGEVVELPSDWNLDFQVADMVETGVLVRLDSFGNTTGSEGGDSKDA